MKTKSMRGKVVDMAALMAKNPQKIALGNAQMNARGDIVGSNGKVIKAREKIAMEYHQNNPASVKSVGLKQLSGEMFLTPAEAVAATKEKNRIIAQNNAKILAQTPVTKTTTAPTQEVVQPHHRKRKLIDDADNEI
jgi:hypothetical protein